MAVAGRHSVSTQGIDIRQEQDRIVFRASLKDVNKADLATGTTELRVMRLEDDGTLDVYDWTTNDFVATGSGTPDDETTMTHRQRRDSTGADVNTGIWTAVLTTLTNWTVGQVYIAKITNTSADPPSQEQQFQFGGVEGGRAFGDALKGITRFTVGSGSTTTNIVTSSLDPAAVATGQFKGLLMSFAKDTATAALRGQKGNISASATDGQITLEFSLTTAPASGDYGVIE